MQFELTADFLSELKDAVSRSDSAYVSAKVAELHPADIADILDEISLEEAKFIYRHLDEEVASDTMMELDEDVREKFLASFSDQQIAQIIDNLSTDDATDLVAELPEERQEEVQRAAFLCVSSYHRRKLRLYSEPVNALLGKNFNQELIKFKLHEEASVLPNHRKVVSEVLLR